MKSPRQKCFGFFFCFSLARATNLNILTNILRFCEQGLPSITSLQLAVYIP